MLKALFKKEFLELNTMYFMNPKTGKRRSTKGIIGYVLLFLFVFVSCAFAFVGISMLFSQLIEAGKDWLYFAITAIPSIFISCFIDMFVANSYLFNAKDNDLLLSLPIEPRKILLVRMTGLYAFGLLYFAITYIPSIGVYWYFKGFSIMPIVIFVFNSLLVLTISVILGFIVAFISSKFKNKAVTTTLIGISLIAVYYFVYFRMNDIIQSIVANIDKAESFIKGPFILFYYMGLGSTGDIISALIYIAIVIVLLAIVYFIVSKNYISIATKNKGETKKVYKEEIAKESSLSSLLVKKELKHFFSSSALMLNIGLSIIILPVLAVLLYFNSETYVELLALLEDFLPEYYRLLPLAVVVVGMFLLSITYYTATSISLEGKNYWIIQTSPIDLKEVLYSKIKTQLILFGPSIIIFVLVVGISLKMNIENILFILITLLAYELLLSYLGILLNLKNPNLTWSNETIVVKQSAPVTIMLFGGWGAAIIFAVLVYFLNKIVNPFYVMLGLLILVILIIRLLNNWLITKGVEIFQNL